MTIDVDSDWIDIAAQLIQAHPGRDGLVELSHQLVRLVPHDNFIVFVFERGRAPQLVASNRAIAPLRQQMKDYIKGLHLLDPFQRMVAEGRDGLFRLADIAPEDFVQSEYFRRHYRFTDVIDELRFIVGLAPGVSAHVAIERENTASSFGEGDVARLDIALPLVAAFVRSHLNPAGGASTARGGVPVNVADQVRAMAPGKLTKRECGIVELLLKGHSAKSVARLLGIEGGTVANHKRNIYAKLDIHSQAQLFDLFLRGLANTF